jgi:peptidoglycan/LPS O-acetylase OafA/YrhL
MSSYRPEIDGLRAIAILAVVFFHVGLGCPGGYIGVDVFFVISGYLISSLILKDLRLGTFSLANFWERRVRRIFPALAACVLGTLVAAWFLLLPEDLENLGKSTVAQTLLAANFYFWRTTNYFGGANEEKPLLHTWSLAVEEQFYLLLPLLLLAAFRFPSLRRPGTLVALILLGLAGSLSIAAWGVKHQPFATFFLLPTRAWELLCGVLVAALPTSAIPNSHLTRESASWLGLGAILLPVWLYGDTPPFPGLAALPPCLGTALFIWGTGRRSEVGSQRSDVSCSTPRDHGQADPPTSSLMPHAACIMPAASCRMPLASRLLSTRPVVFIGLISYSLYLWHWPVIVFCSYWKTAPFSPVIRWALIGISVVLAMLSWRYVETPFRTRRICGRSRDVFLLLTGISTITIVIGGCLVLSHGVPERIPIAAQSALQALRWDAETWKQYSSVANDIDNLSDILNDSLPQFGSKNIAKTTPRFLILGDSHAKCAIPVFDQLGRKYGIAGTAITHNATPPLAGWQIVLQHGAKDPEQLWQASLDYIRRNQIADTFLIAFWSHYDRRTARAGMLRRTLEDTIRIIQSNGSRVWILLDVPVYDVDQSRALVRGLVFPRLELGLSSCNEENHKRRNSEIFTLGSSVSSAVFLDPAPFLLDAETKIYRVVLNGVPLYRDRDHLTLQGAEIAILPVIEQAFFHITKSRHTEQ